MGVVLNIGGGDLNASTFINVLKAGTPGYASGSDAALLDADGYFTSAPSGTATISFGLNSTFTGAGVTYKLVWPSTRSTWTWTFVGQYTKVSTSNVTVTGGSASNMTVTPTPGQAGFVTFTFTNQSHTVQFGLAAGTYAAGSGEIALSPE